MLFNSYQYLFFLPLTTLIYYLLPHEHRWKLLFAASCVFYMAFIPSYILILFAIILIDYTAALWIEKRRKARRVAKLLLGVSIASNLGILAIFKYYNFFLSNLSTLANAVSPGWHPGALEWVLPIGLSFHTFQSISYTVEVYRGTWRAERHLGRYAVYVLYFPQMVAGPIERPQNILPQLKKVRAFDAERAVKGLRLILLGVLKKVLIADNLSPFVDQVYNSPAGRPGPVLLLATYFFAFQIYCDFSGYSDIARGSSRILGVELMKNFDHPYLASSLSEFWRRWHISLSSWFRDYVYIPLGGNRGKRWRQAVNVMVVFMLSSLWHGASWTFVVWGALHGGFLAAAALLKGDRSRRRGAPQGKRGALSHGLRVLLTFHVVCFAWVFFRVNSLADAATVLRGLGSGWSNFSSEFIRALGLAGAWPDSLPLLGGLLLVVELAMSRKEVLARFERSPRWARWSIYYAAIMAIAFYGQFEARTFIYFQF